MPNLNYKVGSTWYTCPAFNTNAGYRRISFTNGVASGIAQCYPGANAGATISDGDYTYTLGHLAVNGQRVALSRALNNVHLVSFRLERNYGSVSCWQSSAPSCQNVLEWVGSGTSGRYQWVTRCTGGYATTASRPVNDYVKTLAWGSNAEAHSRYSVTVESVGVGVVPLASNTSQSSWSYTQSATIGGQSCPGLGAVSHTYRIHLYKDGAEVSYRDYNVSYSTDIGVYCNNSTIWIG